MNRKYEPKSKPKSSYGNTNVVDDPLARWPGLKSKLVGRARGSHVVASHGDGEPGVRRGEVQRRLACRLLHLPEAPGCGGAAGGGRERAVLLDPQLRPLQDLKGHYDTVVLELDVYACTKSTTLPSHSVTCSHP